MEKSAATAELAEAAAGLAGAAWLRAARCGDRGRVGRQHDRRLGVPTLDGLGPVGGADHAPGEYVEIDSIVPRVTLLAALLLAAARSSSAADGES